MRSTKTVFISGNGVMDLDMELENYTSLIIAHIQDNLPQGVQKAMEDYIIQMEISILESGRMIRHMGVESIFLQMGLFTKETGLKIRDMEKVKKFG